LSGGDQKDETPHQLPPLETFCLKPIEIENVSIWVPAAKCPPMVNRACMAEENCTYSSVLPATVEHTKTPLCPEHAARLLAEHTASYHGRSLPLTIFNGWQWEYTFSLCQFETTTYDLTPRGGSWENSLEAILTYTSGTDGCYWLELSTGEASEDETVGDEQRSDIYVRTFSSMRTRDGYPKKRHP
jgi:hypothetical protein